MARENHGEYTPKHKGGGSEVAKSPIESQVNAIRKYTILANGIQEQITTLNESRQENTGVVGSIGDWIGEKTGAYGTGKEIYENQMKQIQERIKTIHAQLLAEFNGKTLSSAEQANIEALAQKLEKVAGTKLEHISWADAVLTSTHITNTPMRYAIRTTAGAAEGAYEGVTGIMEITGKAIGILAAYALEPQARDIIKNDISEIFSQLTLENAKKLFATLPKALEEFQKLPGDKQIEEAIKFIGMMLVPLGIGAKGIKAGKAVAETGLAATKAGKETVLRAVKIIAKQAKRASGASKNALKVAGKASVAGATALAFGTGATTVRYVGEMGGGKTSDKKILQKISDKVDEFKVNRSPELYMTEDQLRKTLLREYVANPSLVILENGEELSLLTSPQNFPFNTQSLTLVEKS